MYINPFLAGVLATIIAEVLVIIVAAIIGAAKISAFVRDVNNSKEGGEK